MKLHELQIGDRFHFVQEFYDHSPDDVWVVTSQWAEYGNRAIAIHEGYVYYGDNKELPTTEAAMWREVVKIDSP